MGPGEFMPRVPIDLQPCDGKIIMTVDGEERQWNVRLMNGATPLDSTIRFEFASS
jgi:hypothetical protein